MATGMTGARMTLRLNPARNPDVEASRKGDELPALPVVTRNGRSDLNVVFGFAVQRATACPVFATSARAVCEISPDRMSMRVRMLDQNGQPIVEPGNPGDALRCVIKAF